MKKSDKMRKLMTALASKPKSKKEAKAAKKAAEKAKKAAEKAADVNKDGVVDEKDVSFVRKAANAVKMAVRKKKD